MLSITSIGQIRLTRGDSLEFPLYINQGDNLDPLAYVMNQYDELYFAIMEPNQPWEQAIVKQKYTHESLKDDAIWIKLRPKDTMCLLPGLYYYQVKIRTYDFMTDEYLVNTLMPKTQFWIEE